MQDRRQGKKALMIFAVTKHRPNNLSQNHTRRAKLSNLFGDSLQRVGSGTGIMFDLAKQKLKAKSSWVAAHNKPSRAASPMRSNL
jgi:hypothetical protein